MRLRSALNLTLDWIVMCAVASAFVLAAMVVGALAVNFMRWEWIVFPDWEAIRLAAVIGLVWGSFLMRKGRLT